MEIPNYKLQKSKEKLEKVDGSELFRRMKEDPAYASLNDNYEQCLKYFFKDTEEANGVSGAECAWKELFGIKPYIGRENTKKAIREYIKSNDIVQSDYSKELQLVFQQLVPDILEQEDWKKVAGRFLSANNNYTIINGKRGINAVDDYFVINPKKAARTILSEEDLLGVLKYSEKGLELVDYNVILYGYKIDKAHLPKSQKDAFLSKRFILTVHNTKLIFINPKDECYYTIVL